jgi:hypothetical protein
MKLDQPFYQFALAVVSLIIWVVIIITDHSEEAKELVVLLNALIGAGIWGGIQQRIHVQKEEVLRHSQLAELLEHPPPKK